MLGLTMPSATNPSLGNPTYTVGGSIIGSNNVVLSTLQMPSHTHLTTVTINDPGHIHTVEHSNDDNSQLPGNGFQSSENQISGTNTIASNVTGLKGTGAGQNVFVTNSNEGGGQAHPNYQPGLGCLYIQYRP
jgi:microcystin-dependent protein